MKLFTHNMLTSKCMKGVVKGYPLKIVASNVQTKEVEFNPEFTAKAIPKLDWQALYNAAKSLGKPEGLPEEIPENFEENNDFLRKAHHVLFEIEVLKGELVCPDTGRKFPISDGIPNMLLTEAEVDD